MIKKLEEVNRKELLEFLSEEASINLFIIGDVENFGFDKDYMELWGGFSEDGEIRSVLLRYFDNFLAYYKEKSNDVDVYKKIIKDYKGKKKVISCKGDIADDFSDVFKNYSRNDCNFCEISSNENLRDFDDEVKVATVEDADRIYNFISSIEEFVTVSEETRKNIKVTLETKTGRIYYIEDDNGDIIAQAETSAECSKAAMVVGVATAKEHRNKGLVSKCISKLCNDVLGEGKKLCLFYDNPIAGRLYKKIGFKDINKWTMIVEL